MDETQTPEVQRKERQPAQYELVREDPRPAANSVTGTQLYQMLEEMKKEGPGDWFRIVTCHSRSGANGIKTAIEKGTRKIPTGDYEFATRTNLPEEGQSALFAKYIGNGEQE